MRDRFMRSEPGSAEFRRAETLRFVLQEKGRRGKELLCATGLSGLLFVGIGVACPAARSASPVEKVVEKEDQAGSARAGQEEAFRHAVPAPPKTPERYTLSPPKRAKAIAYARTRTTLHFIGIVVASAIYFVFWRARIATVFRDWARRVSPRHFVQCLIFVPVFLLAVALLEFPFHTYSGFVVERRFGLSSQTLASWLADSAKGFGLRVVFGVAVVFVFTSIVRHSPRRWWFYFWLTTIPLMLGLILLEPYVVDPLFFRFTPLEKTRPQFTARIEEMLRHAGLDIPRSRIFEMNASAKTRTLNAYVTGLGPSKRVVIWDTTLRRMTEDEALLVVGHETGHYALRHIPKEFTLIELVVLVFFYLGFVVLRTLLGASREHTRVESLDDLAALPLALLVLTLLTFLSSPIVNGISRHYEHQADRYAIEVAYGVVPDPNQAEARSLQILGEEDLDDPDPSAFTRFWLYSHPPLDERIRFAASYKPWAEGKPLELVRPLRNPR